jgi:hypothetical protein
MKTDILWNVVTVPGHLLEKRLQKFTDELYEVVSVEFTGSQWTIIARSSTGNAPKGNAIGFRRGDS